MASSSSLSATTDDGDVLGAARAVVRPGPVR